MDFSSSSWSLMQLTQPKNVVKITNVFLQCIRCVYHDYHGGHDISFVTGATAMEGAAGKTCGEFCMAKVVMSTMEV